jgi:tetratricopeptide (TPR) repeat protein
VARAALDAPDLDEARLAPTVRAKLRVAHAEAALELHALDEAESSSRAAFALLEESGAGDSREAFAALDVLTRTLEAKGDLVAAETLARDTIAGLDRRGGGDRAERTTASTNLGLILYRRGDAAGAEAILRDVVRRRRAELPPEHPALADALNNLGMVAITLRQTAEADALLLEALAIWRATLVPTHQLLADVHYNLGYLRRREKRLDEADGFLRASLAISEQRYASGHPNLAGNYASLGWLALDRGWPREAEADFEKAIAAAERSAEPDRIRLSIARVGRAVARLYLGELSAAEADVERALVALGAGAPAPPNAAAASALFARCQIGILVGDLERADAACSAGVDQLVGSVGPTNIWVLELNAHRTFLDVARGRPAAAAEALAPLVDAIASATGDDPGAALAVRFLRALALAASAREREAADELDEQVRESSGLSGAEHPDTLRIRLERAALRLRTGERTAAERELREIEHAAGARLGEGAWLADVACLLRDGSGAASPGSPGGCPGARARIEVAFPAATAQPRLILEANGGKVVRSASG